MASGIKDKVVIAGMGCSRFGERWDCGPDDLMVEAFDEALRLLDNPKADKNLQLRLVQTFGEVAQPHLVGEAGADRDRVRRTPHPIPPSHRSRPSPPLNFPKRRPAPRPKPPRLK